MVNNLSASRSQKVQEAVKEYDSKMDLLLKKVHESLKPLAQHLANVDLGLKQLASADYYFTLDVLGWMKYEQKRLDQAIEELKPRDGLSKEDVENIKIYYQAFKELIESIGQQVNNLDKKGLIKVSNAPFPSYGVSIAWAERKYKPGENYSVANEVLKNPVLANKPEKEWFATGWDKVKKGFGKFKTGVGVGMTHLTMELKILLLLDLGFITETAPETLSKALGKTLRNLQKL